VFRSWVFVLWTLGFVSSCLTLHAITKGDGNFLPARQSALVSFRQAVVFGWLDIRHLIQSFQKVFLAAMVGVERDVALVAPDGHCLGDERLISRTWLLYIFVTLMVSDTLCLLKTGRDRSGVLIVAR